MRSACLEIVYLFSLVSILLTAGCALAPKDSSSNTVVPYVLVFDEPARLHFSGRGAGAGMMLSGNMGPMGVAIGVAIDVGIAKDLQSAFESAGHSLDGLVENSLLTWSTEHDVQLQRVSAESSELSAAMGSPLIVRVHRVGITATSDVASPEIDLSMECGDAATVVQYQADPQSDLPNKTLDVLKQDGDELYRLLERSLAYSLSEIDFLESCVH